MTLEQLEAKFDAHLAAEEEERRELTSTLTALRKAIYGNGDIGLMERVRSVETVIGMGKKLTWIVAVGVLGLFGSLLWDVIKHFLSSS